MQTDEAWKLYEAIFGTRNGEMAGIELHPHACAAFRIAFPECPIGTDHVDFRVDAESLRADCIQEWAIALNRKDAPDA